LGCAARGAVARCAAARWAADGERAAKNSPGCAARFFWLSRDRTLNSLIATQTTFANRYDANFSAKKIFAPHKIVLNRFDPARAVLLSQSVL
jgi:hypothetical protein